MRTSITILLLLAAGTAMAQQNEQEERREPPTAADFIARLDQDGDGKVSENEFDGPAEHFSQFDANGDGYLGDDEAPAGPPPRGRRGSREGQQVGQQEVPQVGQLQPPAARGAGESRPEGGGLTSRLDKDGDGKVSESEFDGPAEHFSQFDANGDGYISDDEAPSGPPPGRNR